jgi:rhamnogalacturonan endolyase
MIFCRLFRLFLISVAVVFSGRGSIFAAGPDVKLSDRGDALVLENGLVTAVIDKDKAEVRSIVLAGGHNLVSRGGISFDAAAFGQGKAQASLYGCAGFIVRSCPDLVELKFLHRDFIQFLDAEMHFVMRRGVPGIYTYLVLSHSATQPAGGVGQLRWVFRGDAGLLTRAYASATKQGHMVPNDAFQGAESIVDATFRLDPKRAAALYPEPLGRTREGLPVYSKYDWSDYLENHVVHGVSSETEGIFMIQPSLEYYNGGPSKAVLTVHNGPVAILEFLGGHFLMRDGVGINLTKGQEWRQIIGPWLTYVNKASSPAELWGDAAARGQLEKAEWPYAWVNEEQALYPRERGTVDGVIVLPDRKAANALVVLAAPGSDWQVQSMGYEFWTRADADGHFSLPKVRPGDYALYASVPGVVGEMKVEKVHVAAGAVTDLATLAWQPPARRDRLWCVGVPDRSAAEFRFGSEPRQFGLWWRYLEERGTEPLDFTVGQSDPAKDWYYAQSVVSMPDGSNFSPVWNIHFDLKEQPAAGPALLTLDLAGAVGSNARLVIKVNRREVGRISPVNDSSIYRSAVRSAHFRHHTIEFDSALLATGANTVSFFIDTRKRWKRDGAGSDGEKDGSGPWAIPIAGVMYDCIQLETGPVIEAR